MNYDSFILEVHKQFENKEMDYSLAQQLLYHSDNREKRFELFIAMYDSTLKNNTTLAAKVFREAYCASNNIYIQIKNSQFPFNLKIFLNSIQNQGVDLLSLMNTEEKEFYDKLPTQFDIYRGLNEEEHKSGDYGISWSISKDEAEKYIYFIPNNVETGKGGLKNLNVEKKDILTVFSVHDGNGVMHEIIYLVK